MKNKKILFGFLIFILFSSYVSAFMPDMHAQFILDACEDRKEHICCKSPEHTKACINGIIATDFSVVFYFTARRAYGITHAEATCGKLATNAITEIEKAHAYGACMHLITDTVSHNIMVPYSITHSFMPNSIIHVMAEEKLNDWIRKRNPAIESYVVNNLDFSPYLDLWERTLATDKAYTSIDIGDQLRLLQAQITNSDRQTGYDTVWRNKFVVPISIFVIFIIAALIIIVFTIRLIFLREKNWLAWIVMIGSGLLGLLLIFLIIGFSFATWGFSFFQTISVPFTTITPTSSFSEMYSYSLDNVELFMDNFVNIDFILTKDPRFGLADGFSKIEQAWEIPRTGWLIIGSILLILAVIAGYGHFTGRKNFWKYFQK